MRTPEEFEKQVKELGIQYWPVRNCSICNVDIGYEFHDGKVFFRSDCDCAHLGDLHPREFLHVADWYNRQTEPSVIEEMNKFWGFTE